MKKYFLTIALIAILICGAISVFGCSEAGSDQSVTVGDFIYVIYDKESGHNFSYYGDLDIDKIAYVVDLSPSGKDKKAVEVHKSIDGVPIVGIGMPTEPMGKGLKNIKNSVFSSDKLERIYLDNNVESVSFYKLDDGGKKLSTCPNLKEIIINNSTSMPTLDVGNADAIKYIVPKDFVVKYPHDAYYNLLSTGYTANVEYIYNVNGNRDGIYKIDYIDASNTAPQDFGEPSLVNQIFGGWYIDQACTTRWDGVIPTQYRESMYSVKAKFSAPNNTNEQPKLEELGRITSDNIRSTDEVFRLYARWYDKGHNSAQLIYEEGGLIYREARDLSGSSLGGVEILGLGEIVDPTDTLTIPETINDYPVVRITKGAFRDNFSGYNFSSVEIPFTVTELGIEVFADCTLLQNVNFSKGSLLNIIEDRCFANTAVVEVTLPSALEWLYPEVFLGCKNLTRINIPDSVKGIGYGAFGYNKLTQIDISGTHSAYIVENNTLYTRDKTEIIAMLNGNITERAYVMPASVTKVGNYAFCGLDYNTITLSNALGDIGIGAFENCTNITEITLPGMMLDVGSRAFYGCTSLRRVVINTGVVLATGFDVFTNNAEGRVIVVPSYLQEAYKTDDRLGVYAADIIS